MNVSVSRRAQKSAAISPAPAGQVAPQDWEQLVSPGHVLGHRVRSAGRVAFFLALPFFLLSLVIVLAFAAGIGGGVIRALPVPQLAVPEFVWRALTYDPATYTDLGGGQHVDYRLGWMTNIPRTKGLDEPEWLALNNAVIKDSGSVGDNVDRWATTMALATAPKVTRPQKALSEYVDRLGTGIVSLPAKTDPQRLQIVAMVNGAWAWTALDRFGCRSFGPVQIPGCTNVSAPDPAMIADLRPAPVSSN